MEEADAVAETPADGSRYRRTDEAATTSVAASLRSLWELTLHLRTACPWDREQTLGTIVPHTLEESYETAQAVRDHEDALARGDDGEATRAALEDELGDLLFQVCFLAMLLNEENAQISLGSVADRIHHKLVVRHPHVFGDATAATADEVRLTWDQVKQQQTSSETSAGPPQPGRRPFDGLPASLPASIEAQKIQARAASRLGFDMADWREALVDLRGEIDELIEAVDQAGGSASEDQPPDAHVESEVGDVLFAAINVGRLLRCDAEYALRGATARFRQRVQGAIDLAHGAGVDFASLELPAQEQWYQRSKAQTPKN